MRRILALGLIVFCVACQASLSTRVQATLENPEQTGIRWGLVVAEMDGTELIALKPDDRFTPASNTKIITTMAAYHHLDRLETEALAPGTRAYLEETDPDNPPNLVLIGGADAMLSDTPDCEIHCLADLADQIAATGLTEINLIIGDDTHLPFERWGLGWSVEDLQFYYGTAISALSVNDNLVWIEIMPGSEIGDPARVQWQEGDAYLKLDATLATVDAETETDFGVERYPGADTVRIYGHVSIENAPIRFPLAIDNPAEFAAHRLQRLLEMREISVAGIATRHRPLELGDIPLEPDADAEAVLVRTDTPKAPITPIASLASAPLPESLKRISKDSENLHADLALRRLGLIEGTGSRAFGVAKLEAFMEDAGIAETGYALNGGSGMSVYNRISPRSMVQLLAFAARQPWFEAWLADQPIGGVDGSLERRFVGTPLEGQIFAKTGTLNGANALSGVMVAKSGKRLLFSILANDRPGTTSSAIAEMDAALNLIAAAY
ncbi:MAG: D-alanyl-D-alanine carboxypeptidase/D-alanyl-D-alanine-endopeptidase [Hyphomonadaceae bacterium]|nr:D-alanyl-D-alanine carboxypeptidase/D-alanyl-D-alanine-endopeptidase [Hyphomonadaceae bacterium]